VDHGSLQVPEDVDSDFVEICRGTPWGRHDYLMITYTGQEPALLCKVTDAIADLDLLYSGASGTRFACGADTAGDSVVLSCREFFEYDGHAELTYPLAGSE
jgi:hypothetical protein